MQHIVTVPVKSDGQLFQSSPDPQAGCNATADVTLPATITFQSSPDPQAGCNHGLMFYKIQYTISFNPHLTLRPGATDPHRR